MSWEGRAEVLKSVYAQRLIELPKEVELFVPGRVCLLGEHSDWAGGYRKSGNPSAEPMSPHILPGKCLVYATDCGLYAKATRADPPAEVNGDSAVDVPKTFTFISTVAGEQKEFTTPLDYELLVKEAAMGEFFSYACGVAAVLLQKFGIHYLGSITVNNYKTDLPIKKGLSSSAAVCVLVARAFNALCKLDMGVEEIMDVAYQGEILTPSKCGRMDQCCAYGPGVVKMVIDGDNVVGSPVPSSSSKKNNKNEISAFTGKEEEAGNQLPVDPHAGTFYFVVADLCAGKDTQVILEELNQCYPIAQTGVHEAVQMFLGPINDKLVDSAEEHIRHGDQKALGELLSGAQQLFDKHLQPACPSELTAPKLHKILEDPKIIALTFGGKGVGSQGDGSVQFVAKSKEHQHQLCELLETPSYGCHAFAFTLTADN